MVDFSKFQSGGAATTVGGGTTAVATPKPKPAKPSRPRAKKRSAPKREELRDILREELRGVLQEELPRLLGLAVLLGRAREHLHRVAQMKMAHNKTSWGRDCQALVNEIDEAVDGGGA